MMREYPSSYPPAEGILTPDEAAAYLRVTPRTVTKLLREGTIKGIKIGKFWRIRKVDLDMFLITGHQ